LALLDWLSRARAWFASSASGEFFSQSVEIVPSKLKAKVFIHEVVSNEDTIPCWSYVTDGLTSWQQKEIIFTLRREKDQKHADYPRDFFELFEMIFRLAEKGQLVDVGDSTLFNEAGFLGNKDFRGIGYVEPQGLFGVEAGDAPLLAAIMLKGDEAQIAWDLGLTRVSALLGLKYRHYPCPVWSDLKREPVASLQEMDKSLLRQIARVGVRGSYYEENGTIFLHLQPASREAIQGFVNQLSPEQAFALRTQPDPQANACLVWQRSCQERTMAIAPHGGNGSRKTGAFLAFGLAKNVNEIASSEDGFLVFLVNSDWQKLREALLSGSEVFIPPSGKDSASISIAWQKPTGYVSPVSGETYFAGWATYQPEGTLPELNQRLAISWSRTVLLTNERQIAARTTVQALADYINRIGDTIDAFFAPQGQRTKRELTIHLVLSQQGHEVRFVATPDLSDDINSDLQHQLEKVTAPKVLGPVKLELVLGVWDIGSRN
jgi:hypothetical protein